MMKLSVVTPEKKLVTDLSVDDLIVPTSTGEINILPGHSALMTTLAPGILRYTAGSVTNQVSVSWGYCEVADDTINVLAETAERPEDIDVEQVQADLKKYNEMLNQPNLEPHLSEEYLAKKERAMVRLSVVKLPH